MSCLVGGNARFGARPRVIAGGAGTIVLVVEKGRWATVAREGASDVEAGWTREGWVAGVCAAGGAGGREGTAGERDRGRELFRN